jgi:hypothetical protein
MNRINRRLQKLLARGESGQTYAYGGGGLVVLVLVVVLIVLLLR